MYKLIIAPEKAIIPEDIGFPVIEADNLVEKIYAGKGQEVIVAVNSRELQLLVEYRDIMHVEVRAIIGLTGALYNTIWNTYVSTMKRVTVDNLRTEAQELNNSKSDAGQREVSTRELRERRVKSLRSVEPDDVEADDVTGDMD